MLLSPHESPPHDPRGVVQGASYVPSGVRGPEPRPSSRQCPQEQWGPVAGSRNVAIVLPWPPTPRPQVPRPGRLAWSVRPSTRVPGPGHTACRFPSPGRQMVGHQARAHLRTPAHKGSHAQGELKQGWTQGSQAFSLGPTHPGILGADSEEGDSQLQDPSHTSQWGEGGPH